MPPKKLTSDSPTLPLGSNPLAKALGKRIKHFRESRGLTHDKLAKIIGMSMPGIKAVEAGRRLPNHQYQERFLKWMVEGVTYEGQDPPLAKKQRMKVGKWDSVKIHLPRPLMRKLRDVTKRLGFTQDEFAHIAIERLLDNEPVLHTLERAVETVRSANMAQILRDCPDLVLILECDLDLAERIGAEVQPPQEPVSKLEDYLTNEEPLTFDKEEFYEP